MKIEVSEKFFSDSQKLKNIKLKKRLDDILTLIQKAETTQQLPHLKKMTGFKNAFRVRVGNYRLGFVFENNTVKLGRFLHRKDIYKYFP